MLSVGFELGSISLRWTFTSPRNVSYDDVDIVMGEIDRIGQDFVSSA